MICLGDFPETEAVPDTPPVSNPHSARKRESLPLRTAYFEDAAVNMDFTATAHRPERDAEPG